MEVGLSLIWPAVLLPSVDMGGQFNMLYGKLEMEACVWGGGKGVGKKGKGWGKRKAIAFPSTPTNNQTYPFTLHSNKCFPILFPL